MSLQKKIVEPTTEFLLSEAGRLVLIVQFIKRLLSTKYKSSTSYSLETEMNMS